MYVHFGKLITGKQVEKGVYEIVGALTGPVIVVPSSWGDTFPEWLKNAGRERKKRPSAGYGISRFEDTGGRRL